MKKKSNTHWACATAVKRMIFTKHYRIEDYQKRKFQSISNYGCFGPALHCRFCASNLRSYSFSIGYDCSSYSYWRAKLWKDECWAWIGQVLYGDAIYNVWLGRILCRCCILHVFLVFLVDTCTSISKSTATWLVKKAWRTNRIYHGLPVWRTQPRGLHTNGNWA